MGCCFSSLNKFCCVLVHAFLVFRPHSTFAAAATYLRNSNPERWNVYLNDKALLETMCHVLSLLDLCLARLTLKVQPAVVHTTVL